MSITQFIAQLMRNTIGITVATVLLVASVVIELGMLLGHASTIDAGLTIMGTDGTKLSDNPFIGFIVNAFGLNDTTLAAAFAVCLATIMALTVALTAHLLTKLIGDIGGLIRERMRNPEVRLQDAAWELVAIEVAIFAIGVVLLTLMVPFDYNLSNLRTAADIADSTQNGFLDGMPQLVRDAADAAGGLSGVAYIAMFFASSVIPLAIWVLWSGIFARLFGVIDAFVAGFNDQSVSSAAVQGQPAALIHYGYDASGNPVYHPGEPIAYFPDGTPAAPVPANAVPSGAQQSASSQSAGLVIDEPPVATTVAPRHSGTDPATHQPVAPDPSQPDTGEEQYYNVIGNQDYGRVTLAEALGDPRYHVEHDPVNVWWRADYEALMNPAAHEPDPDQPATNQAIPIKAAA